MISCAASARTVDGRACGGAASAAERTLLVLHHSLALRAWLRCRWQAWAHQRALLERWCSTSWLQHAPQQHAESATPRSLQGAAEHTAPASAMHAARLSGAECSTSYARAQPSRHLQGGCGTRAARPAAAPRRCARRQQLRGPGRVAASAAAEAAAPAATVAQAKQRLLNAVQYTGRGSNTTRELRGEVEEAQVGAPAWQPASQPVEECGVSCLLTVGAA